MSESELNKGEVEIELAGEVCTLKPSLAAYSTLATRFEGYWDIQRKIVESNIPTMAMILRLGLGMKESEQQKIMRMLFNSSLADIRVPIAEFVHRLFHNGKSAAEVEAEMAAEEDEGNGAEAAE